MLRSLVTVLLAINGLLANLTTPAVYSYSSRVDSRHPAFLTHHYVQSETDPNLVHAQVSDNLPKTFQNWLYKPQYLLRRKSCFSRVKHNLYP